MKSSSSAVIFHLLVAPLLYSCKCFKHSKIALKSRFSLLHNASFIHAHLRLSNGNSVIIMLDICEKSMQLLIILHLLLMLTENGITAGAVTVTEVQAGHLAELPCLSSDDHHRFMFWQLTDDSRIIGPGNPLDENKYNYEVLSGKLYIRGVSTAESGFYKCVTRGIDDISAINIHVIELVVKKDWEDVWENDFETNLLRGMAAVMVIVVAVAVVLLIITIKRKRNNRLFDLEESRENSPARYKENTPNNPTVISTPGGIDNAALDIDFPKVFNQMQKEQAIS